MNIIKRDGRVVEYNPEKLLRVITWAADNDEVIAKRLVKECEMTIVDNMRIQDLYDNVIKICSNYINAISPQYDSIAKKLYLLKLYKESKGLKRTGSYPHLRTFLIEGLEKGIYGRNKYLDYRDGKFCGLLTEDIINMLNDIIVPDRDMLFNYKGLHLFFDKYCKKIPGSNLPKDTIELPQVTYITAAIHSFLYELDLGAYNLENFLFGVKDCYDSLSKHQVTFSTPRLTFGLKDNPQFASCVLITPSDDINSLNETDCHAALYSKNHGGIAVDFSYIRARGSSISTNSGKSDGPIPFIKRLEQTVSSFNQGGTRSGAAIVYFQWWHLDVFDMINLKDAGGSEELRARKNKYGIKLNRLLLDRYARDEYITLFDPKETPLLNDTYGEEFEKNYCMYEQDGSLMSKRVKAKDLLFEMIRVRAETGNLYIFFTENVNEQEMTNRFISMSNLCAEVVVPSRPSIEKEEKLYFTETGLPIIKSEQISGEIGLCNLSSINSLEWSLLTPEKKDKLVKNLLRGMDNTIDFQYYPAKQGKFSNMTHRPIGIGITDFANLLAFNKIKYTDREALELMNSLMDDLYYRIYKESMELAKERGPFKSFKYSNWAKGLTPVHMSRFAKENDLDLDINWERWEDLGNEIAKFGVRFSLHASIPPSATSGKVTNATESCEPIMDLFYMETGTHNLPTVVKGRKYYQYYQRCWDVPNSRINELAAIRQIYLDQAQSFNHYYKTLDSAKTILNDIVDAEKKGIKTLYYLKTPKSNFELECSSCSV